MKCVGLIYEVCCYIRNITINTKYSVLCEIWRLMQNIPFNTKYTFTFTIGIDIITFIKTKSTCIYSTFVIYFFLLYFSRLSILIYVL